MKFLRLVVVAATFSLIPNVLAFSAISYIFALPMWVYMAAGFLFYAQFLSWGAYSSFDSDWCFDIDSGCAASIVVVVSLCMPMPLLAILRNGDGLPLDNNHFAMYLGALICVAVSVSILSIVLGYKAIHKETNHAQNKN